jgi:microcystin-dependent protein
MSEPFLGEVRPFAGNFAPVGWQLCDGTLLSIAENDALFALLGTTYGGDGITTFAVPDLRSRVPLHQSTTFSMGTAGGVENVTLTQAQAPTHVHNFVASTNAPSTNTPQGNVLGASPTVQMFISDSPDGALNAATVSASGGGAPHTNIQPFGTVTYIIATAGIWPSRP